MIKVVIPIAVLLLIILCKKLPKIGGNIYVALISAGVLSLLMGGVFDPSKWIGAWIDGLDRISWVICLSIFGSIYAETQVRLGTMDTVMGALKAKFYKSPRILVVCVVIALVLSGSLLGDAVAASTVIGVLTIGVLASIGLSPEKICCIIVAGASMGSIMPPISQAFALSSSLAGSDPDATIRYGYITVPIIVILVTTYMVMFFIKGHPVIREYDEDGNEIQSTETAGQILRKNWTSLIPLAILIVVVIFRTISNEMLHFDLMPDILSQIKFITVDENTSISLYEWLSNVSVLKGVSNGIVLSIIFVTIVSFGFKRVRMHARETLGSGLSKVKMTVMLQVCAAFMLGCFYAGGQVDAVQEFAMHLDSNVLKFGGAAAMMLMGMLTGSQSTAQNVVFTFFGPALVATGRDVTLTAVAGAHLAAAGMGFPPVDLTTFVVAGIVGGILGKKVDPLKSMFYMIPMCICMALVGIIFMYI
jgi:TRAP-type C4-dicarboxylate transport system permease large subunit